MFRIDSFKMVILMLNISAHHSHSLMVADYNFNKYTQMLAGSILTVPVMTLLNKKMIQNIFKNWNVVRLLRLAMGIVLVVEAVKSGMWVLVAVGAVFTAMPVLNIGCCTAGNCSVPARRSKNRHDDVPYEEIQ